MASWKDGKGFYTWGTYNNVGNYKKIYAVGGPGGGNSDYFNISTGDMDALRARNFGTGVHFWWDGANLSVSINLILVSSGYDWNYLKGNNVKFVGNSSTVYEFYADIQYQTTAGNWVKLGDNLISRHYGGQSLYPSSGWDSGSGYLWKTFSLGELYTNNIKQFSIGIHGDNASVSNWVYYPIEQIKPIEKQKFTITTRYKIENTNTELRPPDIDSVTEGEPFTKYPRDIDGYESISSPQRFAVYVNREITFWYRRRITEGKITFYYLDSKTGETLKNSEIITSSIGGRIVKKAPPIEGYTPIMKEIALTIQNPNAEYTFYYEKLNKVRPWAIRSSGVWMSLDSLNKWMKIRRNANQNYWDTKSNFEILPSEVDRDNFSASRIRKSGTWKAQGRIGK